MKQQYKCIIFDWDGTLMDSADKIVNTMQEAARRSDLAVPSAPSVHQIIGISLTPAIARLFGLSCPVKTQEVVEHYKTVFVSHDQTPCPLFLGTEQLLENLTDKYCLAVATGKARRGLERAWQQTQTKSYFVDSCCADEAESKPSPDMLLQILERQKLAPEECLMVGDTSYDMQMAQSINMPRIGVSYGVHSIGQLNQHSPIAIIDSPIELLNWL
ncbi:MAG: HAD-IA family hydrolase [Alteromonadaceae bacterium]|nr:HAD-IA family hydrolase [Alteromonadaceae bacterium]